MSDTPKKAARTPATARPTDTAVPADAIERRAYEKYAGRGFAHGQDFDDWRQAEEELSAELARRPQRAAKTAAQAPAKRAAKAPVQGAAKNAARPAAKRAPKKG